MEQLKIYYKSDIEVDITCDVGWATPFKLTFFTDKAKTKRYQVGWDGETWDGCRLKDGSTTILEVGLDDHGLGLGNLYMEMHYMSDNSLMKSGVYDMYSPPSKVTTTVNDVELEVVLDIEGDKSATVIYELPMMEAEAQRQANELVRISNENARIAAETERESAWSTLKTTIETWYSSIKSTVESWYTSTKSAWDTFNATAQEAEQARASAESTRQSNEDTRKSQESARQSAESGRVSAESARATAESNRASAESTRQSNEQTRQSQEATRQSNETARQSAWNTLKQTIDSWYSDTKSAWQTWYGNTQSTWTTWFSNTKTEWTSKSAEIDTAIGKIDKAVESAEDAAESAEQSATDAKEAVTGAQTAIASANQAITTANNASATANAASKVANTAADRADASSENADDAVDRVNEALKHIADKEYAYIRVTPDAMRELIETKKVDESKQYIVIPEGGTRVVAVYFGSLAEAGCELAVADITLTGSSSLA